MIEKEGSLKNVLAAYQCNKWNSSCAYCQYGYGYLDDHGDNEFWTCNTDRINDDMFQWLSIFNYLIEEAEAPKI